MDAFTVLINVMNNLALNCLPISHAGCDVGLVLPSEEGTFASGLHCEQTLQDNAHIFRKLPRHRLVNDIAAQEASLRTFTQLSTKVNNSN